MVLEILISVFGFLSFILLLYVVVMLIRRKEYESDRIIKGYNVLVFGLLVLGLAMFIKGIKYIYLIFAGTADKLIYFDVLSTLILLPIVGASFLVSMFIFKSL